jgi:hypothetical protein
MILETLGVLLTTETAGSVAKFLFEKVEGYIREKLGGNAPTEIENLKTQVKELKEKLEAKSREEVTVSEVEELKQTVQQIEQTKTPVPANIISAEIFQKWSEKDNLDPIEQALIVRRQLQVLMDKAVESGINENKRFEIQDTAINIDQKIRNLKEAKRTARLTGFRDDRDEKEKTEMLLRRNIIQARDLLRGY